MTRIAELQPGDRITMPGPFGDQTSTFIAQTEHPIWPALRLVIWRLGDGTWSHDALDYAQEVPAPEPSTPDSRMNNLRTALLGKP